MKLGQIYTRDEVVEMVGAGVMITSLLKMEKYKP